MRMGYGGQLARTGAGITVLGVATNQWWVVAAAVGAVVVGGLIVRMTKPLRRDQRGR